MEDNKREIKIGESFKVMEGNISMVLDSYDAIFSDFDPRPYEERALSDDFLVECKKAVLAKKTGNVEVRLLIPTHLRKQNDEIRIKKRLKDYFRKHFNEEKSVINGIKWRGIVWILLGSVILTLSTLLFEYKGTMLPKLKLLWDFLFILSQPAGWFMFWEGLGMVFLEAQQEMPNYNFLKKMQSAEIYFLNY